MLSKKNNGKSAIVPSLSSSKSGPTDKPSSAPSRSDQVARSVTEKHLDDPTPSVGTVEKSLKTEEKESAPIFALFHGKIVPLGKLPDTSFKKSHTEVRKGGSRISSNKEDHEKGTTRENVTNEKDENGNLEEKGETKQDKNTDKEKSKENVEKEKELSPSQFIRLSSYFHNLDSKDKDGAETRVIKSHVKDVTGTAKDEVPELLPAMKNSEFLKHVKGIVLDDGKMVTLNSKQSKTDEQQVLYICKYFQRRCMIKMQMFIVLLQSV